MVGVRLAKSRANRSRNRDLTVAFLISSALWIILWIPKSLEDVLYWHDRRLVLYYTDPLKLASFIVGHFSHASFVLYSLINPLVLIFVTRSFQKPIKKLWHKVLKCRDNWAYVGIKSMYTRMKIGTVFQVAIQKYIWIYYFLRCYKYNKTYHLKTFESIIILKLTYT